MADNVSFQSTTLATPASGTVISTDEATSGHVQRVKLAYSADGSDTHISADASGLLVNTGAHIDDVVNAVATTDQAITTKSAVFGYTTSGGGSFEPVKVTPSGALTVEINDGGGSITVDGTVSIGGTATVSVAGTATTAGIIYLDQTRISVTPTVSTTPAYTAKDAVGGKLTFSNAARTSGGSITIQTAIVIDNSQQMPSLELVLFDRDFTASNDNAAFDPSDADLANAVGVIKIGDWSDFNDNAVAMRLGIGLAAKLNGTDLYGQLVTRTTPTFVATSDITVILEIIRD